MRSGLSFSEAKVSNTKARKAKILIEYFRVSRNFEILFSISVNGYLSIDINGRSFRNASKVQTLYYNLLTIMGLCIYLCVSIPRRAANMYFS